MLKEAWSLAIRTLVQVELRRTSEHLALSKTVKQLGINDKNAIRYSYRLIIETLRQQNIIDWFVESVTGPQTLKGFSPSTRSFLRLYVYQTRASRNWMDPDLEEAERIAKLGRTILGWKTLRAVEIYLGFLLTKKIDRNFTGTTDEERTALQTYHPTWFVKYCYKLLGREAAIEFLEHSIYPPPTFIRLNMLKASLEEIIPKIESDGLELEKVKELKNVYRVRNIATPPTKTTACKEGLFYVQDKASCFTVEAADPKPEMTVLDICSAPGAKTTYVAQLMQNRGTIHSIDYSRRRMETWKRECNRMGITIAAPLLADARNYLPLTIKADLVILDPPCTNTGVFGRQPSTKWRLKPKSIDAMAEIQWQMISSIEEKVKPGGFLNYSTSSITIEENELIVERFLKWHPDFHLVDISPQFGLPGLRGLTECRRLYPHLHESNGFFVAKLGRD